MALEPLAAAADLSARGIDTTTSWPRTKALLESASSAVRDAAGQAIAPLATATVELVGGPERWLPLPMSPVRSVAAVSIDGTAVTDWRLRGGRLWRDCGWGSCGPSAVVVTLDYGLDETPADIVDLVCSLVAAGMASAEGGYDPKRGVTNERIDDYSGSFATGETEVVTPMDLPQRTRAWLRSRFGGGVYVTRTS